METIEIKEKEVKALNDLVKINGDRSSGYLKAIDETDDLKLKVLFGEYAAQSKRFKTELEVPILALGGEVEKDSTIAGIVHHVWMDIKSSFTGKDRISILKDCAFGDAAADLSYRTILGEADLSWNKTITDLLTAQHEKIHNAHLKIRDLVDQGNH